MATRWERMKATFKGRKPVSTAEIASDIRAGTVKVFQPAVRAGERFREAQPEVAERISRTATAGQIRESVQIRRDIDTAKRQIVTSEKNLITLDRKIALAPVRDGIFTGTDKQFLQHEADVKAYNSNINRINTENKRISTLEGKKFIPKLERSVSSYIPTLADISKKGAQFRVKYPAAASTIYTAFERAHDRTEQVGTQSQRNALAGYTYGSYSSLQRQPVKTAASFAIGGASVKAIKMVGLVGKAYGAGKWTKRMAKAAQYGLLAYYGKKSIEHIMKAPNSYVAGQRAANIMYTEVLPMAAGIKAVTVAPKVVKVTKVTAKKIIDIPAKEFNKQMRAIEIIHEVGMVGVPKAKVIVKPKIKPKAKTEKLVIKKVLKPAEQKQLERLVSKAEARKGRPLLESEVETIRRSLVKPVIPKTPKEVMAEMKVEAIKNQINDIVNFRNQHLRLFEPTKVELTFKQMMKSVSVGEKPKLFEPILKQKLKTLAQIPKAKHDLKISLKQHDITKSEYKRILKLIEKQEVMIHKAKVIEKYAKVKAKVAVKTHTAQKFAQQLTTSFAVMQLFKQAQKQEAKLKAKQLPKQKQKIVPLLTPAQEAALITKQEIAAARKAAVAEKATPKPPRKVTPKPVRKHAIKVPKLIVPPVIPGLPKRKAKKKPIRKDRQIVTYTSIQFKNRVATIASLFG